MKRKRNLIILAAVLVVIIAVIVAEKAVTKHVDSINTTDEIIVAQDADSLKEISWEIDDASIDFVNSDGSWADAADAAFPVSQTAMEDLLAHFAEVHASFIIEDVDDYDQYGLKNPTGTVTLTTDDGDTVIQLGGYSTMDSKRYVSIGDGNVYLVDEDPVEYLDTDRDTYMQQTEFPEIDRLTAMTVSGSKTLDAVYDKDGVYTYTDAYHYYDKSSGSCQPLDDDTVEAYANTVSKLSLTDYVTYTASDADLSEYGLDDPACAVTLTGTDGDGNDVSCTFYIGTVEEPAESKDEDPVTTGYLRAEAAEIIYKLSDSDLKALSACGYNDLRPASVLTLDWDSVTGLSVQYTDGEAVLTREDCLSEDEAAELEANDKAAAEESTDSKDSTSDEDTLSYVINGQRADTEALQTAIDALTISEFRADTPEKTAELTFTVYLDNADYPSLTVAFYPVDSENCLVTLNGESIGWAARSSMVDIREAITGIVLDAES